MNLKHTLAELKSMGTPQNRKIYARHGVDPGTLIGVSYANLGKLVKQIKSDHELALALWASGKHDARVLATMIGDPSQMDDKTSEAWVRELKDYVLTDAVSRFLARSPGVQSKADKWLKSRREWIAAAGWNLVCAMAGPSDVADDYFEAALERIEATIHSAPNRTRHSMNQALICIGARNAKLEKKAIATAERIGKVDVDHGETGCKTPDAIGYIAKIKAHQSGKKASKKVAKKSAAKKATKKKAAAKKASKKKSAKKAATKKTAKKVAKKKTAKKARKKVSRA